jgi:hypothetical protein
MTTHEELEKYTSVFTDPYGKRWVSIEDAERYSRRFAREELGKIHNNAVGPFPMSMIRDEIEQAIKNLS